MYMMYVGTLLRLPTASSPADSQVLKMSTENAFKKDSTWSRPLADNISQILLFDNDDHNKCGH